jgi:hypothetical protein
MNKDRLPELKDWRVRIRPIARRFSPKGDELELLEDLWCVGQATRDSLVLQNIRTQHVIVVKPDNIHHVQLDAGDRRAIVELHSQVFLQGNNAPLEPLIYPQRTVARIPVYVRPKTPRSAGAGAVAVGIVGLLVLAAVGGFKS